MTTRTLFNIILKVIGIIFIKELFLLVPELFSSVLFLISSPFGEPSIWILLAYIIVGFLYGSLIVYFVFKTNWVIDRFELTKDISEENLTINVHRSTVINISFLIAGLVVLATALPYFFQALYNYYMQAKISDGYSQPHAGYLIVYGLECFISILLIIYRRFLVNYIELRRRNYEISKE